MPRPQRIHVPGGIYHVTLRGNHREKIFHEPRHFDLLGELVGEIVTDYSLAIHAYCWMPNHIHLAIEVAEHPLARPMQKLASVYARRVQARRPTTGHLFERRYHAVLVDSERYLFALVRYIHLNPVRARLIANPESYPWSSHRTYLGDPGPRWLSVARVLGSLERRPSRARSAYCRLMNVEPSNEELAHVRGQESLGDAPVEGAVTGLSVATKSTPAGRLDELIRDECRRLGVEPRSLLGPGKKRQFVEARAWITWRTMTLGLGTLGELAERLGRSPSSLSDGLRRARRRQPGDFEI